MFKVSLSDADGRVRVSGEYWGMPVPTLASWRTGEGSDLFVGGDGFVFFLSGLWIFPIFV